MIVKKHLSGVLALIVFAVFALSFTRIFVMSALASCDSSSNSDGGDDVHCDNTTDTDIDTSDNNDSVDVHDSGVGDIETHDGDDTVNVEQSLTGDIKTGDDDDKIDVDDSEVYGDIKGGRGDDTITVHHAETGDIEGDGHHGSGDDVIQIDGVGVYGDVSGGKGDDSIYVAQSYVEGDINGDKDHSYSSYGGDDTIIVSDGTYVEGKINGGGGNDSITVKGAVIDGHYGTAIKAGDGDDTVTIVDGALLNGVINGGDDFDVLQFKFTVHSQDEKDEFGELLKQQNASCGWVEFNGTTYYWKNFEDLQNLLRVIGASGGSEVKITVLGDTRLNQDAIAGPIAVYCNAGHIEVWVVQPDGHGELGLTTVQSALPQSANGIDIVLSGDQIVTSFGGYSYAFPAIICPG